jgi:hypothetical protein
MLDLVKGMKDMYQVLSVYSTAKRSISHTGKHQFVHQKNLSSAAGPISEKNVTLETYENIS